MTERLLIKKIVDEMMAEKTNTKPFDFLFRRTIEAYPKSNHIAFGLPGIFKNIESTSITTLDGKALQQDFVETVLPDEITLNQEVTYNFEHMSYLLSPEKIEVFYRSKNSTIQKHDKPCIIYMITHIDYKTDELICKINGEAFSIKIIHISPEMIDKNLNTISKKDYSNEEMSELDLVRLVHCLIFSRGNQAKNAIEQIIDIFKSSKMKHNNFIDLHLALKTMIKYHYSDENELRRLFTMITETMSDEELEKIASIEYRLERIEQLEKENLEYKKKNQEYENENLEYKKENQEYKKKNQEYKKKNQEYKNKINYLKAQLGK
ncbi:MAG: hypothetical protein IJG19_05790 [Methanobrevibacter sp.]|nr:hypothetical protein [Methanobrevibacter sp.]